MSIFVVVSAQINHLVPVAYQRLIDLMNLLDVNSSARGLVGEPDYEDIWTPLIDDALRQPVHQRSVSIRCTSAALRCILHVALGFSGAATRLCLFFCLE